MDEIAEWAVHVLIPSNSGLISSESPDATVAAGLCLNPLEFGADQ